MPESPVYSEINLARGPLHQQIADRIQEMVTTQRIQPGEKLPTERDLAQMLGVSRPTIREAMRLMQHRGLVSRKPGGGTYLIHLGTDAVAESVERYFWVKDCSYDDMMQVREMLEPNAAGLAAQNVTPEGLALLADKLEQLKLGFQSGDPRKLASTDSAFHIAIADASGNKLLAAMCASIDHLVRRWNEISSAEVFDEPATKSHQTIFEAIRDRDPARARAAAQSHIETSRQVFERSGARRKVGG